MADKILRPITDVEIVEQMTENDTVLIEQNGEIKRAKGVAGGGSGGDSAVIVVSAHITHETGTNSSTGTCEKNASEIKTLMEAGKLVFLHVADTEWTVQITGYMTDEAGALTCVLGSQYNMLPATSQVLINCVEFKVYPDGHFDCVVNGFLMEGMTMPMS